MSTNTAQDDIFQVLEKLIESGKYDQVAKELESIAPFPAHMNCNDSKINTPITEEMRAVMVNQVKDKMSEIIDILKICQKDENLTSTPARIATMWVQEWMTGRYDEKPRIQTFPNKYRHPQVLVKKCKLQSLCSHHFAPFFTIPADADSYCIVGYKPDEELLGISKISRLVDWYARRPQLQEQIATMIHKDISDTLKIQDVFVYIKNATHTCESTRGAEDESASTTSLVCSGIFDNPETLALYLR